MELDIDQMHERIGNLTSNIRNARQIGQYLASLDGPARAERLREFSMGDAMFQPVDWADVQIAAQDREIAELKAQLAAVGGVQ